MPNRNRDKGNRYERKLRNEFKDLGFEYCRTSRQASRLLDNCKSDLAFLPFHVQAKSVKKNVNYKQIFDQMENLIKDSFPPESEERNKPIYIFHKKSRKKNDETVTMKKEDFMNLIKQIYCDE